LEEEDRKKKRNGKMRVGGEKEKWKNKEQLTKLQKFMLDNNATVAALPPLIKRRWEKLNSAGDDEE